MTLYKWNCRGRLTEQLLIWSGGCRTTHNLAKSTLGILMTIQTQQLSFNSNLKNPILSHSLCYDNHSWVRYNSWNPSALIGRIPALRCHKLATSHPNQLLNTKKSEFIFCLPHIWLVIFIIPVGCFAISSCKLWRIYYIYEKMDKVGYILLIKTAYRICKKGYCECYKKYYLILFTFDREDIQKTILKIKKFQVKCWNVSWSTIWNTGYVLKLKQK